MALKHFGPAAAAAPNNKPTEGPYDTLVAGLLGGYVVFGGRSRASGKISSVNQQIVVYVFARVVLALARLAVREGSGLALPVVSRDGVSQRVSHYAWPVFASVSWGLVMWLFRYHPQDLQPSLKGSMSYIYQQSDEWDSLRNFIWHNK